MDPGVDFLAVGAHPDDVELCCGGTLARLAALGLRPAILDLTRGELGSRGTPASREAEAAAGAERLGVRVRVNAGLPDGGIDPLSPEQRLAVVRVLRELRPAIVAIPWLEVRHPDHMHAARLVEEACFRAGLHKVETGTEPFRPALVLYYMERYPFEPMLVIDVSAGHEAKLEAIRAFRSQFERKKGDAEPATYLTRPEFLDSIVARDRFYGELAGFRFGEPYRAKGPLPVGDEVLLALLGRKAERRAGGEAARDTGGRRKARAASGGRAGRRR